VIKFHYKSGNLKLVQRFFADPTFTDTTFADLTFAGLIQAGKM
jgi:hypothetical protein